MEPFWSKNCLKQNEMDTIEAVISLVKNGKSPMPTFKNILNETQIETVSAFVLEQAKKWMVMRGDS
jgi:cytochrome c6